MPRVIHQISVAATRRGARIALLLMLALLGHDLSMAAEAFAVPGSGAGMPHHASANHLTGKSAAAASGEDPLPAHPNGCGVGQIAAPRTTNNTTILGHAAPACPVDTGVGSPLVRAESTDGWQEPQWPPGVRRALVQVYRM